MPAYGLASKPHDETDRFVVFVHGLNSRPEDLNLLISMAQARGHTCTTFRYPNDQYLVGSAALLARELKQLVASGYSGRVDLVTHSMGGLIVRETIENPVFDPGNIGKLIMVAPPNHGSSLARYACSLDLFEYLTSETRRAESGIISGAFSDGLSEAVNDLEPGSEFLKSLNQRPRNPRVE